LPWEAVLPSEWEEEGFVSYSLLKKKLEQRGMQGCLKHAYYLDTWPGFSPRQDQSSQLYSVSFNLSLEYNDIPNGQLYC
jgi:hypothetical protein